MTKEDISPSWMRKLIREEYGDDVELPPRHVVRICETCNGEFGRRLEQPMSQVLPLFAFGSRRQIEPDDCGLLSAWATKCMLLAFLNSWRDGQWGQVECVRALRTLITTMLPPDGISVRVGLPDPTARGRGISQLLPTEQMPRFEFFSVSRDGPLVSEVLDMPGGQLERFCSWTDGHPSSLRRIWPKPEHPVDLSGSAVSGTQIDQLRQYVVRFRNLADPLPEPVHRPI